MSIDNDSRVLRWALWALIAVILLVVGVGHAYAGNKLLGAAMCIPGFYLAGRSIKRWP